jgi:hypothetical protein
MTLCCQETYDTCQSGFKHIWEWDSPKPVASGAYYKRQTKARRDLKSTDLSQCRKVSIVYPNLRNFTIFALFELE